MTKDYIRGMSNAICVSLGNRYFYAEDEHNPEHFDSVKSHLNYFARERAIDVMVVGFHGRKGPKMDHTVMGTAVTYLSCEAVCPVLIVKDQIDRSKKANGAYSHACCYDDSEHSQRALNMILRIMHPQDSIVIIICEQDGVDAKKLQGKVLRILQSSKKDGAVRFECLKKQPQMTTAETIGNALMSWTKEAYIDFIYVGNKGADCSNRLSSENYLGSVAKHVIRFTKLNVMFCP